MQGLDKKKLYLKVFFAFFLGQTALCQWDKVDGTDFLPIQAAEQIHNQYNESHHELSKDELSKVIHFLKNALLKHGIHQFYLIGGFSLKILKSLSNNTNKISFRDMDIAIVLNKKIIESDVAKISQTISKAFSVPFDPTLIGDRQRERLNKNSKPENYNAGYGSFIKTKKGILDLSFFHTQTDLTNNGLAAWDRILIPVNPDFSIEDLSKAFKRNEYSYLLKQELIIDPYNGWKHLMNKEIKNLNWVALKAKPHLMTLRLLRGLNNNDIPLDEFTEAKLKKLFSKHTTPLFIDWTVHNLDKVTTDKKGANILVQLAKIRFFKGWADDLSKFLLKNSIKEIRTTLESPNYNFEKYSPLWNLLKTSTPLKKRVWFIKGIATFSPKLFLKNANEFLSDGSKVLRAAYFTGDFSPFHNGHKSVIKTVLAKTSVDLVFPLVIPHPRQGSLTDEFDNKEWTERFTFTKLGLQPILEAITIPFHKFDWKTNPNTQKLIDTIDRYIDPNKPLTQIAGGDSILRMAAFGFLDKDTRPRIIVSRKGVNIPTHLTHRPYVQLISNIISRPISSTFLFHTIATKGNAPEMNPNVLKYMMSLKRYNAALRTIRKSNGIWCTKILSQ